MSCDSDAASDYSASAGADSETTNTDTHIKQLLTPLRESIIDKPPYISGTLRLPLSSLSLFYRITKDDSAARHINFAHASVDELEQLSQASECTDSSINDETVMDGSFNNARKVDHVDRFAPMLVPVQTDLERIIRDYNFEGTRARDKIRIELRELNVYGMGSFSNPCLNAPRGKKVFGTLLIVFPTPHEGGTLILRHDGHEWFFGHCNSPELAAAQELSIGYVALLDNFEFEVTPVKSGHLVTLTYDLYDDDRGSDSGNNGGAERLTLLPNERTFSDEFKALLENPEFLPDGGTLGFGLRHVYPINSRVDIKHSMGMPKGSDAIVYWTARALGFEPLFYMLYYNTYSFKDPTKGGLVGHPIDFSLYEPKYDWSEFNIPQIIRREGGVIVCQDPDSCRDDESDEPEKVEWVTPRTTLNEQKSAYFTFGNQPDLEFIYGTVCLVVRIGKAGERLAYPIRQHLHRSEEWEIDSIEVDE